MNSQKSKLATYLYYLDIQNVDIGITFSFSLYIVSLLVVLVVYFRRGNLGYLVDKMRDMLSLILKDSDSFSQFSE